MSRRHPALAALLALSLVVAAVGAAPLVAVAVDGDAEPAPGPLVSPDENTTNALDVQTERGSFGSPNLSVTRALGMQQSSLTSSLTRRSIAARLDAAPNETARRRVLLNATEWIANRTEALRARADAARTAYLRGEISATTYAMRLAGIHSRANDLVDLVQFVNERAEPGSAVARRTARLRATLVLLTGPVRETAAASVRGDDARLRVYVGAGASGVALARLDGGQYVREAVRPEFFVPSRPGIPDARGIFDRARNLYPWALNGSSISLTASSIPYAPYAYSLTIVHPQGRLVAYVGSTGDVFRENQRLTLSALPVESEVATSANNVTLSVDRTYAGGPLAIDVTNATGAPLDARVLVGNESVGRTGEDGRIWAISPTGEYEVTAVVDGERLNVTVSTVELPANATASRRTFK